jgi:hypothetical protein
VKSQFPSSAILVAITLVSLVTLAWLSVSLVTLTWLSTLLLAALCPVAVRVALIALIALAALTRVLAGAALARVTLAALTLIALIVWHGHLLLGVLAKGILITTEKPALMSFTSVAQRNPCPSWRRG